MEWPHAVAAGGARFSRLLVAVENEIDGNIGFRRIFPVGVTRPAARRGHLLCSGYLAGPAAVAGCLRKLCGSARAAVDEGCWSSTNSLYSGRAPSGSAPFGITGWAHPITAAGVVFPGWGWWGLAVTTAGLAGLVSRLWPAVAIGLTAFWVWSAAFWTDPKLPEQWRGVDLELGASLGRDTSMVRHRDLIATVLDRASDRARKLILPESALGFWTPTVERLWRPGLEGHDTTVLAGAAVVDAAGYDNVIVAISAGGSRILYLERMPVPGSMWQPWQPLFGGNAGAKSNIFANPVVTLGSSRVAVLICYEQLIVWPVLQSMLGGPDLIVAVGNGWWTKGTSIVAIQRASTAAWAKLFAKPLVFSFNN